MSSRTPIHRVLSRLATAALSALVLLALASPLAAQASRTRPSSGQSSAGQSSGGGPTAVGGSGSSSSSGSRSSSASRSPSRVERTRPPAASGGGRTVVEHDRRSVSHDRFRYSYHYPYHRGYYPYWGSPYWYWPYYAGWWIDFAYGYPYYYPGYAHVTVYPRQVGPSMGALDLNVRPAKAEVFINGQVVGVVDQFDGWPRYLWLEEGSYELAFYKEGFETVTREYTIYPGIVIDVSERLQPGEAVRPEPPPKATPRRDARIAEERARDEAAAREEDWRERVRAEREEIAGAPEPPAYEGEIQAGEARDARGEPGRVHLAVEPADAAVYLDGRFLGTGRELSRLSSGLIVDPGAHKLSVVRPGSESRSVDFEVEAGQEIELEVTLAVAN